MIKEEVRGRTIHSFLGRTYYWFLDQPVINYSIILHLHSLISLVINYFVILQLYSLFLSFPSLIRFAHFLSTLHSFSQLSFSYFLLSTHTFTSTQLLTLPHGHVRAVPLTSPTAFPPKLCIPFRSPVPSGNPGDGERERSGQRNPGERE